MLRVNAPERTSLGDGTHEEEEAVGGKSMWEGVKYRAWKRRDVESKHAMAKGSVVKPLVLTCAAEPERAELQLLSPAGDLAIMSSLQGTWGFKSCWSTSLRQEFVFCGR